MCVACAVLIDMCPCTNMLTHCMQGVKQEQDVPPPATYEDVGMAGKVDKSHDIQLTSNEAYGPLHKTNILTTPNAAYGQVQL